MFLISHGKALKLQFFIFLFKYNTMEHQFSCITDFPLLNQFVKQLEEKPVTHGSLVSTFPTREQLVSRGSLRFEDQPLSGASVASHGGGNSFQVLVRSDSGQVAPGPPVA
jgi:hypothetical protein